MKILKLSYPLKKQFRVSLGFGEVPKNEKIRQKFNQWGWKGHQGIDFACPEGTEILAVDKGTVILAKVNGDYGDCVVIQHKWGSSLYAHLKEIGVALGESVAGGKIIGLSGQTGVAFGAHLHLAVKIEGTFVDPETYFG